MKMFNDSLATLKYIISSRNVEDTTAFLLTRKIPKNYRECIGEKLPDLEIEDLAGNKLMVGENKNISLIVFGVSIVLPALKSSKY